MVPHTTYNRLESARTWPHQASLKGFRGTNRIRDIITSMPNPLVLLTYESWANLDQALPG